MNYERIKGLSGEIACNLKNDSIFKNLILQDNMEQEIDIYSEEEEISFNDLAYETRQALEYDGYTVVDALEYTIKIGEDIAEKFYTKSENNIISKVRIENELEEYDYPYEIEKEDIIKEAINKLVDIGFTITDSDELITPFPYHCTPNAIIKPFDEDKFKNIKGLELEISDEDLIVEQALAELAYDNIIGTPDNWDNESNAPNISLEEDGSVKYELIFRAQTNEKLLEELEKIKILKEIVENHTGTSAHIHINRAYIEEELGLTATDIIKAAEFLNHPLFLMSGRRKETAHEWARSQLPCPIEANLAEKAKHVDRLNKINYAKHNFVNCNPENTIELRIFSNKCNFNKDIINMYLKTVDFIIKLAEYMKNKTYTKELKNLIPLCKNHFEKFDYTFDFYNTKKQIMDEFKEPKTLIKKAIKNEWTVIDDHITSFINYAQVEPKSYKTIRKFISMIRTLNHEYNCGYNFNINPETSNPQELATKIRTDINRRYERKIEVIKYE